MQQGAQIAGEFYLVDAVNLLLQDGLRMRAQPVEVWLDCGEPETLLETNRHLLSHGRDNSKVASQREGVVILPPVHIDPSAAIRHSVIGPHVTIGADCVIERSLIQDCIIERGSSIRDSTLSASLIGRGARVLVGAPAVVGASNELDAPELLEPGVAAGRASLRGAERRAPATCLVREHRRAAPGYHHAHRRVGRHDRQP
jgi:NDP-sugar pyrophosphorylase family protein